MLHMQFILQDNMVQNNFAGVMQLFMWSYMPQIFLWVQFPFHRNAQIVIFGWYGTVRYTNYGMLAQDGVGESLEKWRMCSADEPLILQQFLRQGASHLLSSSSKIASALKGTIPAND